MSQLQFATYFLLFSFSVAFTSLIIQTSVMHFAFFIAICFADVASMG
tara:strand:+ start:442 stop:582 length:141 start_codon:yes stop_codon:yes gene_type:complete